MSVLYERLSKEIVRCMKEKDIVRVDALKLAKAELLNNQKTGDPKDEQEVLQSYRKKLVKSLDAYKERPDTLKKLENEIAIIDEFLPKAMTKEEIEALIQKHVGLKDFGQVMKAVRAEITGSFDGKLVSQLIKDKLS